MKKARILLVGSGAVGAVYAEHLQAADCEVAFLVRDPNGPNSRMPRNLYQFRIGRKPVKKVQEVPCLTEVGKGWDQIWLCVPSTALTDNWLARQLQSVPESTPVITWTPDVKDRERLSTVWQGNLSQGLIGFASFQSPLPDTTMKEEGIAYLLPPLGASVISDDPAGQYAAALLRKGGLAASNSDNLAWLAARGSSVMITSIAALELSDWSFQKLRKSENFDLGIRASEEAMAASAAALDVRPGLARLMPTRLLLRSVFRLGPKLSPFPLEPYIKYHFGKVGKQTRLMLDSWISLADKHALDKSALQALRDQLQ